MLSHNGLQDESHIVVCRQASRPIKRHHAGLLPDDPRRRPVFPSWHGGLVALDFAVRCPLQPGIRDALASHVLAATMASGQAC